MADMYPGRIPPLKPYDWTKIGAFMVPGVL